MLEAMQERIISAGGKTHKLPAPFFVLATQNPLEQEGTYPLPEAQLDRFLLYIKVGYPTAAEEWDIARKVSAGALGGIESIISAEEIMEAQTYCRMPKSYVQSKPMPVCVPHDQACKKLPISPRVSGVNANSGCSFTHLRAKVLHC